jgi:hypothetical protein
LNQPQRVEFEYRDGVAVAIAGEARDNAGANAMPCTPEVCAMLPTGLPLTVSTTSTRSLG